MKARSLFVAFVVLMPISGSDVSASHGHGGLGYVATGHYGPMKGGIGPTFPNRGPTVINYAPAIYLGWGPYGFSPFSPPLTVVGGGGFGIDPWAVGPLTAPGLDPLAFAMAPAMNPANGVGWVDPPVHRVPARPRRADSGRAAELVTIGDRLLRVGNLTRAVERFEQAVKADPEKAAPIVHLSQISLIRGNYTEAANRLREAQAAQPGWLATAGDVQGLFPEPGDFARHVARLEAHLQANPQDRDAWLVLGAEWYLSGRTQKAADVFLRLSDREEDPVLQAFLDATKAQAP